jgi:hypothetical protein
MKKWNFLTIYSIELYNGVIVWRGHVDIEIEIGGEILDISAVCGGRICLGLKSRVHVGSRGSGVGRYGGMTNVIM